MMRSALPLIAILLCLPATAGFIELSPRAADIDSLIHRSNGVYSVLEAAAAGDIATLEARLAEGENPSRVDELGNSALHYAAQAASPRALELLLAAGADAAIRDAAGRTPRQLCRHAELQPALQAAETARMAERALCEAIRRGDEQAVRSALKQGVNPNALAVQHDGTLLHHATLLGRSGIAAALIEAGANVNARMGQTGLTPLHLAAAKGHGPLVSLLLAAGADVMLQSANGAYPLHDAIWEKQAQAVRLLLPAYAAVNFNPAGGPCGSPLGMAIHHGRVDVLRDFLNAGFNPNDPRLGPETPLILAARSGSEGCVKLLLEAGADKLAIDSHGKTAADYATAPLAPLLH